MKKVIFAIAKALLYVLKKIAKTIFSVFVSLFEFLLALAMISGILIITYVGPGPGPFGIFLILYIALVATAHVFGIIIIDSITKKYKKDNLPPAE